MDHHVTLARAIFSSYESEIRDAVRHGNRPVLVEIRDVPEDIRPYVDVIDHHGAESGKRPTALEAVLSRFGIVPTREQQLIIANDRGHIAGMVAIHATADEIASIRKQDREAQGISEAEEAAAETAIADRCVGPSGLVTVVLPHSRTAAVTDRLSTGIGGSDERLLILSPDEVSFFGDGKVIGHLMSTFGGYCGGMLPDHGYWALDNPSEAQRRRVATIIEQCLAEPRIR